MQQQTPNMEIEPKTEAPEVTLADVEKAAARELLRAKMSEILQPQEDAYAATRESTETRWTTERLLDLQVAQLKGYDKSWWFMGIGNKEYLALVRSTESLVHKSEWQASDERMDDVSQTCELSHWSRDMSREDMVRLNNTLRDSYLRYRKLHQVNAEPQGCFVARK